MVSRPWCPNGICYNLPEFVFCARVGDYLVKLNFSIVALVRMFRLSQQVSSLSELVAAIALAASLQQEIQLQVAVVEN